MKHYTALIIEDNPDDTELLKLELNKLDFKIDCTDVDSEAGLRASLDEVLPDIVISDYGMPGFTGLDALKIVREQKSDLPFILCSGLIGEEQAVDAVKNGVTDYCLKKNLGRLGLSVERELKNYEEHKKKIKQLEKTNSQFENLIQSVNGIVWEAEADTLEFLYVSPQVEKLLGYSPEEWLGEPNFWQHHIHPDDRKEAIQFCHDKTQQSEDHSFEYRMLNADGEVVWLRDYVTVVTENGEPNRLHGFMVDISREKKAERQRDKAYDIADIGHWELDLKSEKLYWSKAVKIIHEVDPDYEPNLEAALELFKEGEHRQEITRVIENTIETGESFEVELQIDTPNGNEKWIRVVGETEFRKSECIRIYGSTQDISIRKVSEKKYRDIFNLSPQPMWVYDPKTLKFLDINRAAMNHYGFSFEEFMQMTLKDIRPEDEIPDLMEAVKERRKKDSYYEGQFRHKTKDESIIYVNLKSKTIDYEGRKAAIVLAEDVTEKLEAERKLQLSEQKFKSLVLSGASMITVLTEEGVFTYVSENYEQITGWTSQELIGKNAFEFMHPDEKDRVKNLFTKLQTQEGNQHTLLFRFKHKEGHWIWKESIGSDLSHSSTLNGYVINSHDVTERRYYTELEKIERDILEESITNNSSLTVLAEKLLLKLEDLHPCMIYSIHKVVDGQLQNLAAPSLSLDYLAEIKGLEVGPHAGSCGAAAYLKEPVIAKNIYENVYWEGYRHLGDKYDFSACWSLPIIDSNQNVMATFAIYYKTLQTPSEREKNTIERVAHLLRFLFDSFEKEKAEQKLALREQRFKSLVQDGLDLIAILDQNGIYKYVAPTSKSVLGISPEEFIGNNALDYIHDKHKGRVQQVLATLPGKKRINIEPFLFKDGKGAWRWVETIITNLLDNPAIEGFIANSRDVTDQIEREKKLRENLELYEYVTKATNDVIYNWDLTEDIFYWDDSFHDKFIYNIGKGTYSIDDWVQNVHPEDRSETQKSLNDHLESSESKWEQEYRFKKQDGSFATVFARGFIIRDQNGKAIRMIGSLQDITERKVYQEELEQLSLVASKTTDLIIMTDPDENITWVNQSFVELTGYSFEESMGQNPGELLQGPGTDSETVKRLAMAIENHDSIQEVILNYSKTGQPYWLDLTIDPIFDEKGNCEGFIAIEREVTEKVERQKELRESLERYEIVSKATSDTIWDWDLKTNTIDYSQNIYNMFGYKQQHVDEIEDWWRKMVHPDDRSKVFENIEKAQRSSSERFQLEYRFKATDGTYKYIYDRAYMVEDEEGNPIRVIGAMRDVSDQKEAEHKMKEALQERERILDRINEAFFAVDQNWNVTYWNNQAEDVIGVTRDDIVGENLWETFPVANEQKFFKEYKRALQEQVSVQFEEYYPPLEQWLEVHAYPSEEGLSVLFRNITERIEAKRSLRELYQKYRLVLESTDEGIYGIDTEGICTFINRAAANKLGYHAEECIGKNMHKLIHYKYSNGELYPESECPIYISKNRHESCRVIDEVFWKADGTCFNVEYTSNPMIEDGEIKGVVVAFSDITARKQQEKELQDSLKEKETLLLEIHHRVKNNLALISSMMQLQILLIDNEYVQEVLNDSIYRIKTMAMIHELLYKSPSFSRIYLNENIEHLISILTEAFDASVNLIPKFNMEDVELNINQAIPCMLLMNEIVTNILKHAFRGRKKGNLSVELSEKSESLTLKISDDGVGLPDNFNSTTNEGSVGLILIETLAEQLDGEYSYQSLDPGTLFTFSFKKADIQGIGNAHL